MVGYDAAASVYRPPGWPSPVSVQSGAVRCSSAGRAEISQGRAGTYAVRGGVRRAGRVWMDRWIDRVQVE